MRPDEETARYLHALLTCGHDTATIVQRGPTEWGWFDAEHAPPARDDKREGSWRSHKAPGRGSKRARLPLTHKHVGLHWHGSQTWGCVLGDESRIGIWDIDAHEAGRPVDAEVVHDRVEALCSWVAQHWHCTPLVVSTPRAPGRHVYVTSAAPRSREDWSRALRLASREALGKEVEVFPSSPRKGDKTGLGVRLPLGIGWDGDRRRWVETRIMVPGTTLEMYGSRAEDLQRLTERLAAAEVSAAAFVAPPQAQARELAKVTFPLAPLPGVTATGVSADTIEEVIASVTRGPESQAHLKAISDVVFRLVVVHGASDEAALGACVQWAARNGVGERDARAAALGSITWVRQRIDAGLVTLRAPGTTVEALTGVTEKPRVIAPRFLYEPAMLDRWASAIPGLAIREEVVAGVRAIGSYLRAHGTVNQGHIDRIVGTRQVRMRVEDMPLPARWRDHKTQPRPRLGALCRDFLLAQRRIFRDRNHVAGEASAVYYLDYATAAADRAALGLPPITTVVDGELALVPCDIVEEVVEVVSSSAPSAAYLASLLGDDIDEVIVTESPEPTLCRELLERILCDGAVEDMQEHQDALGRFLHRSRDKQGREILGLAFATIRDLRRARGLPQSRVRVVAPANDEACPTGETRDLAVESAA